MMTPNFLEGVREKTLRDVRDMAAEAVFRATEGTSVNLS
jgi:hypothetical protein